MLEALGGALGERAVASDRLGGGSLSEACRARLESGRSVFVKGRSGALAAEFEAEAAGLRWLAAPRAVPVPEVLAVLSEPPLLALAWVEAGRLSGAGADALGRGLAELHLAGAGAHGALPPGSPEGVLRIGPLELAVREHESWSELYAADRLLSMLARARDRGAVDAAAGGAVERVCARIAELGGPAEPPSRLHGDLWSGNVLADEGGRGWLIDPAAHGGHREVDLAMLRLFGSPPERLFDAYAERHPLPEGHAERIGLWQLFPLLVHAVLFGGHYGAAVRETAERYA